MSSAKRSLGFGSNPLFSILVVTYNRATYLNELLLSLAKQGMRDDYELIIIDNGSAVSVNRETVCNINAIRADVKLVRHPENLHSPIRWIEAVSRASGKYILLPGDDDVLFDGYLQEMKRMALANPDAALLSVGIQEIDENSNRLGRISCPPIYACPQDAVAHLIEKCSYSMPGTGFNRELISIQEAPRTRTAFDWWIWLQCWMFGEAASSDKILVGYRQHPGQEQIHYDARETRIDAFRMMNQFVTSNTFRAKLSSWSQEEVERFTNSLIRSDGPLYGDPMLGSLIQIALADVLANREIGAVLPALFSQAMGSMGLIDSRMATRALTGQALSVGIPRASWSRTNIRFRWDSSCEHIAAWRNLINNPLTGFGDVVVVARCTCTDGVGEPSLRFSPETEAEQEFDSICVSPVPDQEALDKLLFAIASAMPSSGFRVPRDAISEWVFRNVAIWRRRPWMRYLEARFRRRRRRLQRISANVSG